MPLTLTDSVGQGGANRPADVWAVQQAMKDAAVMAPGLLTPGDVDGKCGPGTIGDITEVQRYLGHVYKPDGRIDVGGWTHRTLSAAQSVALAPWTFPLGGPAEKPYMGSGAGQRAFRFRRSSGTRSHAGRDLVTQIGTPVYAVADGVVSSINYYYADTWCITLEHTAPDGHKYICRYGETARDAAVSVGQRVRQGQQIGEVGDLTGIKDSMVHFEVYLGTKTGAYKQTSASARDRVNGHRRFYRRADLCDAGGKLLAAPYPTPGGCS